MVSTKSKLLPIAVLCAACALVGAGSDRAHADGSGGQGFERLGGDYPYLVVNQALPDVLRELGHNLKLPVEVSAKIKGRVERYQHGGTSREFLERLASEHGLEWVIDDGGLFVSSVHERVGRSWSAGPQSVEAVKAALASAGVGDPRFSVRYDPSQGVLTLSAPPRYMAEAGPIIDRVLAPKATRTVNVIHGRARNGGT